jgi:fermentation-respiration switch protein FrsA (DUF1100 family)
VDRIGDLSCPVLIVGGEDDVKTLPADTRRLFEAARDPKELWMVPKTGHRDLFSPEYRNRVAKFIDKYMK